MEQIKDLEAERAEAEAVEKNEKEVQTEVDYPVASIQEVEVIKEVEVVKEVIKEVPVVKEVMIKEDADKCRQQGNIDRPKSELESARQAFVEKEFKEKLQNSEQWCHRIKIDICSARCNIDSVQSELNSAMCSLATHKIKRIEQLEDEAIKHKKTTKLQNAMKDLGVPQPALLTVPQEAHHPSRKYPFRKYLFKLDEEAFVERLRFLLFYFRLCAKMGALDAVIISKSPEAHFHFQIFF